MWHTHVTHSHAPLSLRSQGYCVTPSSLPPQCLAVTHVHHTHVCGMSCVYGSFNVWHTTITGLLRDTIKSPQCLAVTRVHHTHVWVMSRVYGSFHRCEACSRSLFIWNFEKRRRMVVSGFRFRFAFRWPFRVSTCEERGVWRHSFTTMTGLLRDITMVSGTILILMSFELWDVGDHAQSWDNWVLRYLGPYSYSCHRPTAWHHSMISGTILTRMLFELWDIWDHTELWDIWHHTHTHITGLLRDTIKSRIWLAVRCNTLQHAATRCVLFNICRSLLTFAGLLWYM